MIQLVEVLASKSDGRSPVSGTHSEGESQFYKLSSGLHLHTKIHVCAHTSNRGPSQAMGPAQPRRVKRRESSINWLMQKYF